MLHIDLSISYYWLLLLVFPFWWWASGAVEAYTVWLKHEITLFDEIMWAPGMGIFFALDVFLNYTLFLVTMGLPPKRCFTISDRFMYYRNNAPVTPKYKVAFANLICSSLNVLVLGGHHC